MLGNSPPPFLVNTGSSKENLVYERVAGMASVELVSKNAISGFVVIVDVGAVQNSSAQ